MQTTDDIWRSGEVPTGTGSSIARVGAGRLAHVLQPFSRGSLSAEMSDFFLTEYIFSFRLPADQKNRLRLLCPAMKLF